MVTKDIDYEFVEDTVEELTCSICMKVLCEPHLVNCCGQQFCEHCLEKWLLKNKTSPHCRSTDYVRKFLCLAMAINDFASYSVTRRSVPTVENSLTVVS